MRFRYEELARARTLKAMGFPWRPKLGDWYVDHTGYCELIRTIDDMTSKAANGNIFLPAWDDCRAWLADRGWGHPEVMDDAPSQVMMLVSHEDGRSLTVSGVSDLDCLYRFILMVQLRTPTRDAPPPIELD